MLLRIGPAELGKERLLMTEVFASPSEPDPGPELALLCGLPRPCKKKSWGSPAGCSSGSCSPGSQGLVGSACTPR